MGEFYHKGMETTHPEAIKNEHRGKCRGTFRRQPATSIRMRRGREVSSQHSALSNRLGLRRPAPRLEPVSCD